MKSYIIRIYRGEKGRSGQLLGTVERPGEEIKLAFTSFDELKAILEAHAGKDVFAEAWELQKDKKPNRGIIETGDHGLTTNQNEEEKG